jgi:hypothetical protein
MIRALLFLLVILLLGCDGVEKPKKPEHLISKSKMIDILTEAYLSNAARSISSKNIRDNGLKLDSLIFKKYQIDSLQFVESNVYYSTDLNVYAEIFEKVETKLLLVKDKADSIKKEDKRIRPGPDLDTIEDKPMLGESLVPDSDQEDIE